MFRAIRNGWSKETVGGHIVRGNHIHDCGQNGIVGHMGCAFSLIEDNHIHNIATKHEFFGHEIGGIKFHAAIDTIICHNHIHDCALGTWLDWEMQGTRITRNIYHDNWRDFMIEVTSGPCLIDNNVFGSFYSLDNVAQGTGVRAQPVLRHRAAQARAQPLHAVSFAAFHRRGRLRLRVRRRRPFLPEHVRGRPGIQQGHPPRHRIRGRRADQRG